MRGPNQKTVLVIDDEAPIRDMVRFALEHASYSVVEASNADEGWKIIADNPPALILLDWMLPGTSGIDLTKRLRVNTLTQNMPIILLTAKAQEDHRVRGLEVGADDYITKPFSPRELVARVKAVLRRGIIENPQGIIVFQGLQLDSTTHQVTHQDQPLKIGPTEYRLLYFFMTHQERVFAREQILHHVWGGNVYIDERTVDVHVRRLRKILEPLQLADYLQTVRCAGYRFGKLK